MSTGRTTGVGLGRPIWRGLVRARAVFAKETIETLSQPRLLATLILGPFLILVLFAAGFSKDLPQFRTVFVAAEDSDIGRRVDGFAHRLAQYIDYRGLVADREDALAQLRNGDVDLVAILPEDPYAEVRENRRAVIEVYHDSVDPLMSTAVEVAASVAAESINQRILATVVAEGQSLSELLDDTIPAARLGLTTTRLLLEAGDRDQAEQRLGDIAPTLQLLSGELSGVLGSLADLGAPERETAPAQELRLLVADLDRNGALDVGREERLAQVLAVEAVLDQVTLDVASIRDVEPIVLVRPFRANSRVIGDDVNNSFDFYVPSAVVLLLQHLAITFSSMSVVRERELGTTELMAVAPLSAGEALLGKYVSYLLIGGGVAFVLGLATHGLLDVPLAGSPFAYALGLFVVLLGSLGIGFLVSLIAKTDTQAVQLSMLVLLASFFFTGFFLTLERMQAPVDWIAQLLPATHGIAIARDVALRGRPLPSGPFFAACALAAVTFTASWYGFARRFQRPT